MGQAGARRDASRASARSWKRSKAGTNRGESRPRRSNRAYAAWWLPLAMDASDELRRFTLTGITQDAIVTFCKARRCRAAELAPVEVMRRIAHGLPAKRRRPEKVRTRNPPSSIGPCSAPPCQFASFWPELPQDLRKTCPVRADVSAFGGPVSAGGPGHLRCRDLRRGLADHDLGRDRSDRTRSSDHQSSATPSSYLRRTSFGRADDEDEELPEVERDMPSILDEVSMPQACRPGTSIGTIEAGTRPSLPSPITSTTAAVS